MKQRQFKSHEHTQGLAAKTSNAQVSMILSPMKMTDINKTEQTRDSNGNIDWTEMIKNAEKSRTYYLNNYGSDSSFIRKKPDGTLLRKGM